MSRLSRSVTVWGALVALTLLSWAVGPSHGAASGSARAGTAVALLVAFGKAWLVGSEFMELRHAPRLLRAVFGGWVVVVGTTLTVLYLAG